MGGRGGGLGKSAAVADAEARTVKRIALTDNRHMEDPLSRIDYASARMVNDLIISPKQGH